jgi:Protein of unknown function (DUF4231)
MSESNIVLKRLEDQITWYDSASIQNKRMFKLLKTIKIVIGASVPLTTYVGPTKLVPAALGAGIVILESLHELSTNGTGWLTGPLPSL